MDLFSLDSVILIIVTCNCLPFSYSRSIFRRHISWQVLKIAFRSLQIWKLSRRGYPQDPSTRLLHWTLAIMPPHPRYKKPIYGPSSPSMLTVGLLAQTVERCNGVIEVKGSNPGKPEFCKLSFRLRNRVASITAMISFSSVITWNKTTCNIRQLFLLFR